MDLSGEDLDNVTRTILGEVGPNATPASMAAVASVIRNVHSVTCKPLATSGGLSHPEVLERRLGCIPGASKVSLACGRA